MELLYQMLFFQTRNFSFSCGVPDSEFRSLSSGFRVSGMEFLVWALGVGVWGLGFRVWSFQILDWGFGFRETKSNNLRSQIHLDRPPKMDGCQGEPEIRDLSMVEG